MSRPMHVQQFHYFAPIVPDLDEVIGWYGDVLGFRLERRFGFAHADVEVGYVVDEAGVRREFIQQVGSMPSPDAGRDVFVALLPQGANHVGFLVADLDATAGELRAEGVEVVVDVTAVAPAGIRPLWVRDAAGHLIGFNQWLA